MIRDVMFFAGLALLLAGLAAYDWRWAALAAGVFLMAIGILMPRRG